MTTYLQLDEIAFQERFRPLLDAGGAWFDFDWTDAEDARSIELARIERRLWTTLDVDGFVVVASGWHFVNRLGYVITEEAAPVDQEIEVFDPDELEDWTASLREAEESGSETQ